MMLSSAGFSVRDVYLAMILYVLLQYTSMMRSNFTIIQSQDDQFGDYWGGDGSNSISNTDATQIRNGFGPPVVPPAQRMRQRYLRSTGQHQTPVKKHDDDHHYHRRHSDQTDEHHQLQRKISRKQRTVFESPPVAPQPPIEGIKQNKQMHYISHTHLKLKQQPANNEPPTNNEQIMECTNATNIQEQVVCCAPWNSPEEAIDEWWTHHPDWEEIVEHNNNLHNLRNNEQICFGRMQNPHRAAFFRDLYSMQFPHDNGHDNLCSQDLQVHQINAGYGASVNQVVRGLWAAHNQRRPFQMTKHWEGARWLFSTNLTDNWNYCDSMDMNCYFLPLSSCQRHIRRNDKYNTSAVHTPIEKDQFQWARQYVTRPKHVLRKQLRSVLQEHMHNGLTTMESLDNNCTAMHVRRGDVGYPRHPFRRYAAVQEYLDIGEVAKGSTIVLLTDDDTTIEEVDKYHSNNYEWVYLDRPRNHDVQGGMDGHIPSGDEGYEIVMIMAEVKMAAQCHTIVHGKSGFVTTIKDEMDARRGKDGYKSVYLDTQLSHTEIKEWRQKHNPEGRAQDMMQQIHLQQYKTSPIDIVDDENPVPPKAIINAEDNGQDQLQVTTPNDIADPISSNGIVTTVQRGQVLPSTVGTPLVLADDSTTTVQYREESHGANRKALHHHRHKIARGRKTRKVKVS